MDASESPSGGEAGDLRGTDATDRTDAADRTDGGPAWLRRRWTTIVLEADGDRWRATQAGVAVEGRGETAADAATEYCRKVATSADERRSESPERERRRD